VGSGIAGIINSFSGLIIVQDPVYTPYVFVTGSSLVPNYDLEKTYSIQSLNAKLINKTGAGSRYITISPLLNSYGRYFGNKRHKLTYYTRYSGTASSLNLKITEVFGDRENYNYYTETLDNSNDWEYKELEFIPGTGAPKFEYSFAQTATDGDQFWLDDVNLSYYDDCYPLPTIEQDMGGFNLPYLNSTTNFSGFATNADRRSISVLKPQDAYLTLTYNDFGVSVTDWKLQSVNLELPINREDIFSIDNRYPEKRITYPIIGNLTLEAVCGDYQTGSLRDYYFDCNKSYDVRFGIRSPCNADLVGIEYYVKQAKLNSISWSDSIGSIGKTASMQFSYFVSAPNGTGMGLFMSGITNL